MEINNFSISGMPKLVFGVGSIKELPIIAREYGKRVLLVTGGSSLKSSGIFDSIQTVLLQSKLELQFISVSNEPTPDIIDRAVKEIQGKSPHLVIAIGGGSVIDTGKAISAMLAEEGSVWDYLEGIGKKKPSGIKAPFIAIPTTSGTGSEATKNSVLSVVGTNGFKKSLRHDNYIPDVAIIDPELMISCPPSVTAACGMDTLSQLIESYISTKANPMTDALALSAIQTFKDGFIASYDNGMDLVARGKMAYSSFISGFTLSHAGLGTVHGIAGHLGGLFSIPHGVACGTLLSEVMGQIIEALKKDKSFVLNKISAMGKILEGSATESDDYYCERFVSIIEDYTEYIKMPRLGSFGIKEEDIRSIVDGSDNKLSPVLLDMETMAKILRNRL